MTKHDQNNPSQNSEAVWYEHTLFESVPKDSLHHLLNEMKKVSFDADEEIITQGDSGRDMYLMSQGKVHVTVASDDGKVIVNKEVEAPAILGEMALVTREPRAATVRTLTPVQGLALSPIDFLNLTTGHPEVAGFLTGLVGDKLKEGAGIRAVGKYRILRQLGSGAAATVFEAAHPDLGTTVALKMLSHSLVAHAGFSAHFAKEGRTTAKLDHPNIVRIMDTERAYGTLFIVMERLHGTVLSELLEGGEKLPSRKVRIILMDCCRALSHTHEAGLIHRDIKPSNLFMTQDGVAKLLDFGIAARIDETATNSERVGTPYFMSPEQIRGRSLDGRADLYSLGIMAFRLLTGKLPFNASDLKVLLKKHLHSPFPIQEVKGKGFPQDLVRFIEVSTRKNPAHRYSSCKEALAELTSGRELPFVHTLLVGLVEISIPTAHEGDMERVLKGFKGLLSVYGIRFAESHSTNGEETHWRFSVTAHPSHRKRVEGAISAMKGLLQSSGLGGEVVTTWSPEECKEEDELAFPKDILTSS